MLGRFPSGSWGSQDGCTQREVSRMDRIAADGKAAALALFRRSAEIRNKFPYPTRSDPAWPTLTS